MQIKNIEMIPCKLNGEFEIILPKHRAERPEWYTENGWEKKRLKKLHDVIVSFQNRKNGHPLIYYVGAEEGEMPALCQMWGAGVVMFEPNPKAWSHIRAIWEANKLDFPQGIFAGFASSISKKSNEDSEFNDLLKIGEDGWPVCSTSEMEAAHGFKELNKEAGSFSQRKIDDYYMVDGLVTPDIICLDVEGAEGHVLRGAEQVLRAFHPMIFLSLHPEFLHEEYKEEGASLRKWLIDIGYKEELLDYPLHEIHLLYHL